MAASLSRSQRMEPPVAFGNCGSGGSEGNGENGVGSRCAKRLCLGFDWFSGAVPLQPAPLFLSQIAYTRGQSGLYAPSGGRIVENLPAA